MNLAHYPFRQLEIHLVNSVKVSKGVAGKAGSSKTYKIPSSAVTPEMQPPTQGISKVDLSYLVRLKAQQSGPRIQCVARQGLAIIIVCPRTKTWDFYWLNSYLN